MIAHWWSRLFRRAPTPRAWQRRSVVELAQVDPTPVLCGASIVQALRRAALLALVASCGGPISVAGDHLDPSAPSTLTQADLDRVVALAIKLGNGTSDSRLHDVDPSVLDGYRVHTMPVHVWTLDDGRKVSGWTSCPTRTIVIGTPPSGVWEYSSLVHELFHAIEGCPRTVPVDEGCDEHHGNWVRDGLYAATRAAWVLP